MRPVSHMTDRSHGQEQTASPAEAAGRARDEFREPFAGPRLFWAKGASIMEITAETNQHIAKARRDIRVPSYQAFEILHWGFVAAPFLAGLDKFLNLLTNWEQYLSPAF